MRINITKEFILGVFVGLISPLIFLPLVIQLMVWIEHLQFGVLWDQFFIDRSAHTKLLSMSVVSNLIWFYLALNNRINFSRGVLIASLLFVPYVLYRGYM